MKEIKKDSEVIDVEVKEKEGFFKKLKSKVEHSYEWLYDRRHLIGLGALGMLVMYAKGHLAGELHVRENLERDKKEEIDFLRSLVGEKTGLTEEQLKQGRDIKQALDDCKIDMDKLYDIQEYWSTEDWEDFMKDRF